MPLKPGGRTSLVSESTTLNSICRIGCPTEPTTFKKAHKREKKKSLLRIELKDKSEMSEESSANNFKRLIQPQSNHCKFQIQL